MDYRQRIIEEASLMFRTYGIRAVTMDMLATRLSISKRTIYEIFRDKDELLESVVGWMTGKQKELMDKVMADSENIIEAIFRMLRFMSNHYREMSPAFKMDMKKYYNHVINNSDALKKMPWTSTDADIIKRGIKEGLFREDIDIGITHKCFLEFSKLSADSDAISSENFMDEEVIRDIFINYMRGISTAKGLGLIDYYSSHQDFYRHSSD